MRYEREKNHRNESKSGKKHVKRKCAKDCCETVVAIGWRWLLTPFVAYVDSDFNNWSNRNGPKRPHHYALYLATISVWWARLHPFEMLCHKKNPADGYWLLESFVLIRTFPEKDSRCIAIELDMIFLSVSFVFNIFIDCSDCACSECAIDFNVSCSLIYFCSSFLFVSTICCISGKRCSPTVNV